MEKFEQKQQKEGVTNNDVEKIKNMMLDASNRYLPEKSPIKDYIYSHYSDFNKLKEEMSFLYKDLNSAEIKKNIEEWDSAIKNKTLFIEKFQRLSEREDSFKRREQRLVENPLADEEELNAGAYKDELESQVSNAVFMLRKKGYNTFQSGFKESSIRDQFVDVYNKEVKIPESIIEYFKNKKIEISIKESNDRTTITLHPLKEEAVILEEWKNIWDDFADKIPGIENTKPEKEPTAHTNFREKQKNIRDGKNTYLGPGVAFVNGKTVSMSFKEFKEKYDQNI